ATEKVATASQALGAAMYEQEQAAAGAEPGAAAGGAGDTGDTGDDDIVDAEVVDEPTDEK
ncbi:MAG: molecular chaperone DnaK, partial [Actinomycetota bacterium]|nr:molecular chaperone DnaK [Actinomycetota bacterium]